MVDYRELELNQKSLGICDLSKDERLAKKEHTIVVRIEPTSSDRLLYR